LEGRDHCQRQSQTTGEPSIDYSDSTPDVTLTYTRFGALKTAADTLGTRTFTYNSVMQPDAEAFPSAIGKVLTRRYATSGVVGRYNELWVGITADPDQDYDVDYGYDAKGRLNFVDGPGLTTGGVYYGFLADSDLVEKVEFKNNVSAVIASTTRSFESQRDLLTQIENKYGTTVLSKYAYVNDDLERRTSVVGTGDAFTNDFHRDFTYNDRSELLSSITSKPATDYRRPDQEDVLSGGRVQGEDCQGLGKQAR